MAFVEKKCSRCHQFNWDSQSGSYNETCTVDGRPCDTNGTVYIDTEAQ
jgi:phage FluMu protein Com